MIVLIGIVSSIFADIVQGVHLGHHEESIINHFNKNPVQGPGSFFHTHRLNTYFHGLPQVLVYFSHLEMQIVQNSNYSMIVHNITKEDFIIEIKIESKIIFANRINCIAFCNSEEAEVIYFENHNTTVLNNWNHNENRAETYTINFTHKFDKIPSVVVFLIGLGNVGKEIVGRVYAKDITLTNFTLLVQAWLHTNVFYFRAAIFAFEHDDCTVEHNGSNYWNEQTHNYKEMHPWVTPYINGLRQKEYNFTVKPAYKHVFTFAGIAGYEFRGNIRTNLTHKYHRHDKSMKINGSTWDDAIMPSLWFYYGVCEIQYHAYHKLTQMLKPFAPLVFLMLAGTLFFAVQCVKRSIRKQYEELRYQKINTKPDKEKIE